MMGKRVRKQIYIDDDQERELKRLASDTGRAEAEIIREALDRQARVLRFSRRDLKAWERELTRIDALIAAGPVAGGRKWQRDELHER